MVRVKRQPANGATLIRDLADGCLVQMADELETGDILTLDSDFEVYRWRRTRKFRNLLG